ncbi:MAG: FecR domain-containing protein [Spirochaetales bacterium]|nr:FecR domain-containing protein [Spirochaetales bacterium]
MKKALSFLIFISLISVSAFSLAGELVYVEGTVDVKSSSGRMDWADIGMSVKTGDSIITGYDGYAEIEMEDGSTVKINEDSIFKLDSVQQENEEKNSFQLVLGSASYKFSRVLGNEPRITTPSTVCGLRGTEFTVYSGLDGSALYLVDDGAIAVSSRGAEVELGKDYGVMVEPGQTPGRPFEILRGKEDYTNFLSDSEANFMANPAGTVFTMMDQLEEYADLADENNMLYEVNFEALKTLRDTLRTLEGDEKSAFYAENVFPAEVTTSGYKLNVRYHALSAKSMRRFVIGNMYLKMTTQHILDPMNPDYLDFLNAYNQFLHIYETRVVPYLVEADIQ